MIAIEKFSDGFDAVRVSVLNAKKLWDDTVTKLNKFTD